MAEESPEHGPTDQGDGEPVHEPTEISYAEYLHPARPRSLRHRPRVKSPVERRSVAHDGPANGENPAYVEWLRQPVDARRRQRAQPPALRPGHDVAEPVRQPGPAPAVDTASVWFTAYPLSLITRPGESFLAALADEELWKAFAAHRDRRRPHRPGQARGRDIGLAVHAQRRRPLRPHQHPDRPGVRHRGRVPGAVRDRRRGTAARSSTTSCPATPARAPTSASPRWRYGDYPGIYHMVEIEPEDWHLLPDVPAGRDSVNLDAATEDWLAKARLHHRPPAAGDLLRRGRQGDQLERHPAGRRRRRRRAALGLPALLQGRPAVDQLARPVVRRACGW